MAVSEAVVNYSYTHTFGYKKLSSKLKCPCGRPIYRHAFYFDDHWRCKRCARLRLEAIDREEAS